MPKVSGKDLISDNTEKIARRTVVVSSIVIFVKLYKVPLDDLKLLGMELPAELFDIVSFALVCYFIYSFIISWIGDLLAFRLWFRESSLSGIFGAPMKTDKSFLRGGTELLKKLYCLEKKEKWPSDFSELDEATKKEFQDFKVNVENYINRFEHAGTRFRALSLFGHFYVWIHSFLIPLGIGILAIFLLVRFGIFNPPTGI